MNDDALIELATSMGNEALVADFHNALQTEEKHLAHVRQWVAEHALADMEGEVEKEAA